MDQEFVYHSDPSMKDMRSPKKHLAAKRTQQKRSLSITIADIILITVLGIFLMPYLLRKGANVSWQGYEWNLKNQALSGQTFIALRIRNSKNNSEANKLSGQPFSVVFFLDGIPINEEPMHAILPQNGGENFVRLTLPALQGKRLTAEVSLSNDKVELGNAVAQDST